MHAVLLNLLTNAVKHAPSTTVRFAMRANENDVTIEVVDKGVGVAPEMVQRMSADRGQPSESYGGLGLGVRLDRGIVEAHGGQLSIESVVGHGTKITLSLPRLDSAPEPPSSGLVLRERS